MSVRFEGQWEHEVRYTLALHTEALPRPEGLRLGGAHCDGSHTAVRAHVLGWAKDLSSYALRQDNRGTAHFRNGVLIIDSPEAACWSLGCYG